MYQPHPSRGQPDEPPRPPAPSPVRTAIKFMYAGAAVSTVPLIIALAYSGDINAYHLRWNNHNLTAAQVSQWRLLIIAVGIVFGLVVPAVWLWLARANGQGQDLGAHLVHGAVRLGDAATGRRLYAGDPCRARRGAARPARRRADLAVRRRRGVAALAAGIQRVLQGTGLRAGATSKADAARAASKVTVTMVDKLSTQATEQASRVVEDAHRLVSSADCGFDGSPVRHTWPTMTWPNNNFL